MTVIAALSLLLTLGCGNCDESTTPLDFEGYDSRQDATNDAGSRHQDLTQRDTGWPQLEADGPIGLPPLVYEADCYTIKPPTSCEWIYGADAVVIGEILDLRGFLTPAFRGNAEIDDCPFVEGGLELEIATRSTTHGSPPAVIKVRIGQEIVGNSWHVSVTAEGINWRGGKRLAPGMMLGMALHEIPDRGVWSPGHSLIFEPTTNGLAFQNTEFADCHPGPPTGLIGISVEDLLKIAAECNPDEGADRRAAMSAAVEADPYSFYAAFCY